jgi:lysophospholipase L1-like esterase
MESTPPSPARPTALRATGFAVWLGFLGLAALLLALLASPGLLRRFAEDRAIATETARALRTARVTLLAVGGGLLLAAIAALRWRLFGFLEPRPALARWLTLLTGVAFVLAVFETFFAAYPVPSRAQSVPYDVSAFSINRLADFDTDVAGARPGTVQAHLRNGYRGLGFPVAKPPGEFRVVVLGGSFVFDIHATGEDDWPHRAEVALREAGGADVRVVNGGVPGHSSFDSIGRLVGEVRLFDPDVVILCNAWNDIKYFNRIGPQATPLRVLRPMARPSHRGYALAGLDAWLDRFHLVRLVRALSRRLRHWEMEGRVAGGALADSVSAVGVGQFRLNLSDFVDICRNAGITPVIATQPHLPTAENEARVRGRVRYDFVGLTHPALCRAFEKCEAAARAVAAEKGCALLDLSAAFTGREDLFVDHVHLNRRGSQAMAQAVAEHLAGLRGALKAAGAGPQ